jgi:hypothetical protein
LAELISWTSTTTKVSARLERILFKAKSDQSVSQLVLAEVLDTKAWSQGSAAEIVRQAKERQVKEGWGSVQPAVSITLHGFMMRMFLVAGLKEDRAQATHFLGMSVETLDLLNEYWANVPVRDKSVVFSSTFVGGVKLMHLPQRRGSSADRFFMTSGLTHQLDGKKARSRIWYLRAGLSAGVYRRYHRTRAQ